MKILIIIPTYNERESLPKLLESLDAVNFDVSKLKEAEKAIKYPLKTNTSLTVEKNKETLQQTSELVNKKQLIIDKLFVDDNSPDGTAELVQEWQATRRDIYLISRFGKLGLGTAYLEGFAWALNRDYEAVVQMDADLSHDPVYLSEMLAKLDNFQVVIGSRYVAGGGVENWPILRRIISKGGSWYSRNVLSLPIRDVTGGFNVWSREALLALSLNEIKSNGYSFQVEMKYQASQIGLKMTEFPIIFKERHDGQSKMSQKIVFEAMWRVWLLLVRSRRIQPYKKIIKFGVVGLSGFIIDFGVLLFLVEVLKINLYLANAVSFGLAVVNTFLLNKFWTFRSKRTDYTQEFVQFLIVSLIGLTLSLVGLRLLVQLGLWYVLAKIITVAGVAIWNFSINNFWTFHCQPVDNSEKK
ncbi:glycosyltransferase family 2 protein [Candidatus Falkowbacteria bacterium]|nr:glycosyltransferase family 2 protein [Candidatus Falkowbacteria bacterium]